MESQIQESRRGRLMRPTASPAALSEGNAPCGDLQDPVPTGSLPLWTRQDRQLFAALSSSGGGTLHDTSHSDPLRNEPATGQPEASADRPALEAIREATARAPRTSGCEVPRADRRL